MGSRHGSYISSDFGGKRGEKTFQEIRFQLVKTFQLASVLEIIRWGILRPLHVFRTLNWTQQQ